MFLLALKLKVFVVCSSPGEGKGGINRCGVLAELTHSSLVWVLPCQGSSESRVGPCVPLASMTSEVVENEFEFYSKAEKYWKDVPATVDGMLGGYGHISSIDINSSRKFLQRFLRVGGTVCRVPKTLLPAWS